MTTNIKETNRTSPCGLCGFQLSCQVSAYCKPYKAWRDEMKRAQKKRRERSHESH